jgi:branched-chain amino acid transport system substrate-binding protein
MAPEVQNFIRTYKETYHAVPDALAAMGYDATRVLAGAMSKAPSLSPLDIRKELAQTKDFPGVTGKITINNERNAVKPAVVLRVDNGQFKYVTTVNP